jgi:signal transduction histidine kinase
MSDEENTPGSAIPASGTREKENAELKAKVAFLENKLQLVGSITRHDVLNQMTAIMGYNELLGMMIEDPKLKSFLEKERFALDKIRRQFQFAKDYQNIAVEPPRWENIHNLTVRVVEAFDMKGIQVIANTGNASVLADPGLDKVFHHLIENALRHGETVTEIQISLQERGAGGLLVVVNNGTGIPPEEKNKIFERGYGKGTGWGLFLAKEILAVTGMSIRECGNPEKGVRFEITLPAGMFRMNGGEPAAR